MVSRRVQGLRVARSGESKTRNDNQQSKKTWWERGQRSLHNVRAIGVRPTVHGRRGRRERVRELMVVGREWRISRRTCVELHVKWIWRRRYRYGRSGGSRRLIVDQTIIPLLEHGRVRRRHSGGIRRETVAAVQPSRLLVAG